MSQDTGGLPVADGRDMARIRAAFEARRAPKRPRIAFISVAATAYFLVAGWLIGWGLIGVVAAVAAVVLAVSHFAQSKARAVRRERLARAATDDEAMVKLSLEDLKKDIDAASTFKSLVWVWGLVYLIFVVGVVSKWSQYSAHPELWDERTQRSDAHQVVSLLFVSSMWIPQWLRARRDLPRLVREREELISRRAAS